jgi:hypothetical protein
MPSFAFCIALKFVLYFLAIPLTVCPGSTLCNTNHFSPTFLIPIESDGFANAANGRNKNANNIFFMLLIF